MSELDIQLRTAEASDVEVIAHLIGLLATYQGEEGADELTVEQLTKDGFGAEPAFEVLLAEVGEEVVGMAFYYEKYSTWKGRMLYLEDLIVIDAYRSKGVGGVLMDALDSKAKERGCYALGWQVIDHNERAISFYRSRGATLDGRWINCYSIVNTEGGI